MVSHFLLIVTGSDHFSLDDTPSLTERPLCHGLPVDRYQIIHEVPPRLALAPLSIEKRIYNHLSIKQRVIMHSLILRPTRKPHLHPSESELPVYQVTPFSSQEHHVPCSICFPGRVIVPLPQEFESLPVQRYRVRTRKLHISSSSLNIHHLITELLGHTEARTQFQISSIQELVGKCHSQAWFRDRNCKEHRCSPVCRYRADEHQRTFSEPAQRSY